MRKHVQISRDRLNPVASDHGDRPNPVASDHNDRLSLGQPPLRGVYPAAELALLASELTLLVESFCPGFGFSTFWNSSPSTSPSSLLKRWRSCPLQHLFAHSPLDPSPHLSNHWLNYVYSFFAFTPSLLPALRSFLYSPTSLFSSSKLWLGPLLSGTPATSGLRRSTSLFSSRPTLFFALQPFFQASGF